MPPESLNLMPARSLAGDWMADRRAGWLIEARRLILARLADARAHAEAAQPALAIERTKELGASLVRLLGDARADFYRQSLDLHRRDFDPEIHQQLAPHPDVENYLRTAPLAGRDQARELLRLIATAGARLDLTIAAAGSTGDAGIRAASYRLWERKYAGVLDPFMATALSDSQVMVHHAIGRLMVRPELRT